MENRSVGEMLFVLVVAFALYNMGGTDQDIADTF
jgi:hypothetical protein